MKGAVVTTQKTHENTRPDEIDEWLKKEQKTPWSVKVLYLLCLAGLLSFLITALMKK